jgi:hypothetical protein
MITSNYFQNVVCFIFILHVMWGKMEIISFGWQHHMCRPMHIFKILNIAITSPLTRSVACLQVLSVF